MFCIQDPSYENSKYLHETLISECVGCTTGAGAYAFATKDGINLLLLDDNFKDFLETGTFTLVVGTDDITNEHSIVSLIELQKKYGSHLVVKAYVHNGKGSTFHPKFSWFQKTDGGALVLGSGNLTQKGLRHNREAYNVVQYDEFGITEVIDEWNRWFVHSAPFLFDITDPVVLPDKLMRSRSKVILIDEFEKASKPVYNFFLQLLEEGKFTDSLGREYDLDKYIIIFTSNMPKEKVGEYLPPELRSRFSYKCAFGPLSTDEKNRYVTFKSERYLEEIKRECPSIKESLTASNIVKIDVSCYSNMRDINNEIMRQITEALYSEIVK